MNTVELALASLDELREVVQNTSQHQLDALAKQLLDAKRVYVAAAGRSLLAMKFLAMRLMQLGFTTYLVGEVCTPSIQAGDLLLIGSGSGTTASMCAIGRKARQFGARVALITKNPDSALGKEADVVVCLNTPAGICEGAATADGWVEGDYRSLRPSGNPFEQAIVVVGDAVVCALMQELGHGTGFIAANHANLE